LTGRSAEPCAATGYTVHYGRAPRLFADLDLAHGDGRFARLFRMLVKFDPLVLDDWRPDRLSPASGSRTATAAAPS
jgi:DNA replication protein DnaC